MKLAKWTGIRPKILTAELEIDTKPVETHSSSLAAAIAHKVISQIFSKKSFTTCFSLAPVPSEQKTEPDHVVDP